MTISDKENAEDHIIDFPVFQFTGVACAGRQLVFKFAASVKHPGHAYEYATGFFNPVV